MGNDHMLRLDDRRQRAKVVGPTGEIGREVWAIVSVWVHAGRDVPRIVPATRRSWLPKTLCALAVSRKNSATSQDAGPRSKKSPT